MIIYIFFPNDGCAIVYCISRISLLDMKYIYFFCLKTHHYLYWLQYFSFSLDLSDTKGGGGDIC